MSLPDPDQLPLDWEPSKNVRSTDPDTSHAAAESLDPKDISRDQKRVEFVLNLFGDQTDQQVLQCWHTCWGPVAESTPRKRRHDLVEMGRVEKACDDEGNVIKRPLISGRMGIVWHLVKS